jgi:hypothetical protein
MFWIQWHANCSGELFGQNLVGQMQRHEYHFQQNERIHDDSAECALPNHEQRSTLPLTLFLVVAKNKKSDE